MQDDELDKALRLTTEVDGKIYPTVTGMLLIGKESSIEKLMPTAKASFQVLEGTKVRVNIETSGPLLEVFENLKHMLMHGILNVRLNMVYLEQQYLNLIKQPFVKV